jgi:hypothetical protein
MSYFGGSSRSTRIVRILVGTESFQMDSTNGSISEKPVVPNHVLGILPKYLLRCESHEQPATLPVQQHKVANP